MTNGVEKKETILGCSIFDIISLFKTSQETLEDLNENIVDIEVFRRCFTSNRNDWEGRAPVLLKHISSCLFWEKAFYDRNYKVDGSLGFYRRFVPEDYVILKLEPRYKNGEWVRWHQEMPPGSSPGLLKAAFEFSRLKLGYRGDLKFREHPEVFEVAPLLSEQAP